MFARSLRSPRPLCSSSVSRRLFSFLAVWAALFTAGAYSQQPNVGELNSLLAAARSAVGPEGRLVRVRSITAEADCLGPRGRYTTSVQSFRDDKTRFTQSFTYKPETTDIFVVGETAWERKAGEDVHSSPFTRMAARVHEYQKMAFEFGKFFHGLELAGEEMFEGRPSRKVRAKNELGMPVDLFFDVETKRFRGFVIAVPNSAERIRNVFLEWRSIDGLNLPAVVRATDSQGEWMLRFHTIRLNRADATALRVPPRIADMAELLRLHEQQKTAHLSYNAELFVEMFAENLTQLQRGDSVTRTKAENLVRLRSYFSSFKFSEWEDIRPPVLKISKDGSMAAKMVQKSVKGTFKNEKGEDQSEHTVFAWLEVWEKSDGRWNITAVASTERQGEK